MTDELQAQGDAIVAVSTDGWDAVLSRQRFQQPGFTALADPRGQVIDLYGVRDVSLGADCARPALFLIGRDGRVIRRHLTSNWRVRLSETEARAFVLGTNPPEGTEEAPR